MKTLKQTVCKKVIFYTQPGRSIGGIIMKRFFVIVIVFFVGVVFARSVGAQAPLDPVKYGISKNVDPSWKIRKVDMGGSFIIAYGSSSSGIPEIESRYNAKSNVIEIAVINGGERNAVALEESKKRAIALSYKIGQELPTSCGAQLCYAKSHGSAGSSPGPAPTQIVSAKKAPAGASKAVVTPAVTDAPAGKSSGNRVYYSELPKCKCKPGNMSWEGTCNCDFQDGMENEKVISMLRWVSWGRFSKGLGEPYSRLNYVTFVQDDISAEALAKRDMYGQH
jgi:hypothetical protein